MGSKSREPEGRTGRPRCMRLLPVLALAATVSVACASPSTVGAKAEGSTSASASTAAAASASVSGSQRSAEPTPSASDGGGASGASCSGFGISLARGAKGKPTAALAFAAWLAGKPDGFDPDPKAWHVASHITGKSVRYADGAAHVFVVHIDPPGSGWIAMSGSSCA
jgi:hypothetical protein